MKSTDLTKRNAEIVEMRKQGCRLQYIATIYNISRERVRQICNELPPQEIIQLEGQVIEWLSISNRVLNALHQNDIHTIPTLETIKNYERLEGIREKGAAEIKKALKKHKRKKEER